MVAGVGLMLNLVAALNINLDRPIAGIGEALLIFLAAVSVMVVLLYIGIIAWMLFARAFFTKAEVEAIAYYGPHTRFDRWLVNTIYKDK